MTTIIYNNEAPEKSAPRKVAIFNGETVKATIQLMAYLNKDRKDHFEEPEKRSSATYGI